MRWQARSSDLPKNGRISDFAIRGQQKRFAQDDGKRLVPIEREVKGSPLPLLMAAVWNDTEIMASRFHQDIGAAQVDLVSVQVTTDNQEFTVQGTSRPNFELR